jgi:hypothetical protein
MRAASLESFAMLPETKTMTPRAILSKSAQRPFAGSKTN